MKKNVILFLLLCLPPAAVARPAKFTWFAPHSIYIYGLASWLDQVPVSPLIYAMDNNGPDSYSRGSDFTAALGAGFTVFNAYNRFLLDLEFDWARTRFPSDYTTVSYYSFTANFNYRFTRSSPLLFFIGIGGGWLNREFNGPHVLVVGYSGISSNTFFTSVGGIKWKFTDLLALRVEARVFSSYTENWSWYLVERDWQDMGERLAIGLEIRF